MLVVQLLVSFIYGQSIDNITSNDVYEGCSDIVACTRVTLKPGFHALYGSRVHAYTDNITPPPSNEYNPDIGGISVINDNPSNGENYVKTTTLLSATNIENEIESTPRTVSIEYFNGWGNPIFTIGVKASPNKKDIISNIYDYDNDISNRLLKEYMPYESDSNDGSAPNEAIGSSIRFYSQGIMPTVDADEMPWKDFLYENSPLNRSTGESGVGQNWKSNNHHTEIEYKSNTESISSWTINAYGSCVAVQYPVGSLSYTETTDEDGLKHIVFTDKLNRVILVKDIGINTNHRTAYVYDYFNRLRYVVPPQASSPNDAELCYSYTYDKKGRITNKTIPSHGSERYVYDKRNRVVLSQDDNQYNRNEWSFILYDAHDRVVINGFVNTTPTQNATYLQGRFDSQTIINEQFSVNGALYGYSGNSLPNILNVNANNVLSVNWYDNYDFLQRFDGKYTCPSKTTLGRPLQTDLSAKGLLTGNLDKAFLPDDTIEMIHANYYDSHGRDVCLVNDNHLSGKTFIFFTYTFGGELEEKSVQHSTRYNADINISSRYEYDHWGRLVKEYFKLNSYAEFVAKAYEYNAVGNLANTYLHSTDNGKSFQQKLKNHYNIRGWLTNINDFIKPDYDLFTMKLGYENAGDNGRYNGSLSQEAFGGRYETPHSYSFTYKGMDWLYRSVYKEGYGMNQNTDAFSETYEYNSNGNITGLVRKSNGTTIDNLQYSYYPGNNKISNINDQSHMAAGYPVTNENYLYDYCGNTTYDPSKMAYITYNRQNKPILVSFTDDDFITYSYTSTGTKLRREVTSLSSPIDATTDYSYNFMYEDGQLICIFAPFGRIVRNTMTKKSLWKYHYTIADHLGNARVEFVPHNGGQPEVVQSVSYYPFGYTLHCNDYGSQQPNRHLFGGKELQDQTLAGITFGWYDFEARMYDPAIGRFMQTDPMAEKYYWISPYAYCANNPIKFIDPTGEDIWELNTQGKVVNHIKDQNKDVFYMVDSKGNRIDGKEISFEYGTIEKYQSQYSNKAKTTFDWYNVRGDENGTRLFEFFANNTIVEFSQLLLGQNGDKGLNIISTSHEQSTERSINFLLDSQYKNGYTIRGHNHNHPENTPYPSGLYTGKSDIGFSNNLTKISQENGSGIPTFKIYLPATGNYIEYSGNSTYYDFLPTINLPEINFVAPQKY